MSTSPGMEALYREHLRELCARTDRALEAAGYEQLVIYSGSLAMLFLDDQSYPCPVQRLCVRHHAHLRRN